VALVQACQDARRAYRNWFDSLSGQRKGRKVGHPVFRRKHGRQSIRLSLKPLHVRQWTCAACGTTHDRDVNAAKNILAAGRADKSNACGGSVRPGLALAVPGEAGTHRSTA